LRWIAEWLQPLFQHTAGLQKYKRPNLLMANSHDLFLREGSEGDAKRKDQNN
jgi:hypothetical protein